MNNDLFSIITGLLRELELNAGMFNLNENSIATLESKNIILARKGYAGDYFLLVEIQPTELHSVNRDLQTSLMSHLTSMLCDTGCDDFCPLGTIPKLKIDNHLKKNTTLLLFIHQTDNIDNFYSTIIEIEEDEYFFKKQVVLLNANFLSELGSKITSSRSFEITKYLQESMSDTENFNSFIKQPNIDTNYAGCAQLFEKLPFLHLNISSSEPDSLQNTISNIILSQTNKYTLMTTSKQDDDYASQYIDKELSDIVSTSLAYSSEVEREFGNLDAEALLKILQGN